MLSALVAGAVFFPGLYGVVRRTLSSAVTGWSDADAACVSERVISAIHASLATAAGVVVVTSCKDVMTDSHWLVNNFSVFGASYMVLDLYAMYVSHYYQHTHQHRGHAPHSVRAFLLKDWLLVLHHIVLLLIFLPITLFFRRGLGDFFIGCLFITELSTPFISIGKILIQLRLDHSRLHTINGMLALLTFFTCRILLFPFIYWKYGQHFGVPLHKTPFHLPLQCNVGNLLILAPQIYWFILLLRKARRLYFRRSGRLDQQHQPKTD